MELSGFFDYPGDDADAQLIEEDDPVLGAGWSGDRWATLLAHTEVIRVRQGEHLIRIGEVEQAIYVVERGRFSVTVPGRRGVVLEVQPGTVIGEVAFFDSRPRSADVVAAEDAQVRRLSQSGVERMAARHPDLARDLLMSLGRILAFRLRRAEALARA